MRLSRFWKQQSLVVARAMEDMHHFDGAGAHSVENQVIAERTSADTEMFVARHQRISARRIRQRLTFFPQLLREIKRDFDTRLSYVGCNLVQIGFGFGGKDNGSPSSCPGFGLELRFQTVKHLGG
jgi:hypothetical protein